VASKLKQTGQRVLTYMRLLVEQLA